MIALETRDIGGGIVRRHFTDANRAFRVGEKLSSDQILAWPSANRRALVENRFIEVYPRPCGSGGERYIVRLEKDKFNVVEGRVVNEHPLSREQAERLLRAS